jgi:hypothetical protein
MAERRKARRYELYLPVQVCLSVQRPVEFHTGQLRDVSRSGVFFQSTVPIDTGTGMELTFSLPAEKERGTTVLVRASAKALRVSTRTRRSTGWQRRSIASTSSGLLFPAPHNLLLFTSSPGYRRSFSQLRRFFVPAIRCDIHASLFLRRIWLRRYNKNISATHIPCPSKARQSESLS